MDVKVFWTDFSKGELGRIFNFYKEIASLKIAKNIVTGITHEVSKLISQPKMGQKEEHLVNREQEFRYFVYKTIRLFIGITWEKIGLKSPMFLIQGRIQKRLIELSNLLLSAF